MKYSGVKLRSGVKAAHELLVLTVRVQVLAPQQAFHCVLFLVDRDVA